MKVVGDKVVFCNPENTIPGASLIRWLVPPAARAIHLCIGMAYGFSVHWLLPSRLGCSAPPKACDDALGFFVSLIATDCDWRINQLG